MLCLTIAARELRSLFLSPLAWSILAVVQLILAYLFLAQVDVFTALQGRIAEMEGRPGVTDLIAAPLFGNAGVVLLLVAPLATMRLIAEERRHRTISLLLTAPVSMTDIVLGKYLGVFVFLLIPVAMTTAMPLSLLAGGSLDFGKLAACVLALTLLVAAFAALGLYFSCIADHPTVAAVGTFGALLLLWILDWSNAAENSNLLAQVSMMRHYQALLRGLVSSSDVTYFLLFVAAFLVLSVRRLDNDRLQK